MTAHAAVDRLSAWLDGELDVTERRRVEAHLESCPECSSRVAGLRRVAAGLESLRRLPPPAALDAWAVSAASAVRSRSAERRRFRPVPARELPAQALVTPLAGILALALMVALARLPTEGATPIPTRVVAVPAAVLEGPAARIDDRFLVLVGGLWRDVENLEIPLAGARPATTGEQAALLERLPGLADLLLDGDVELVRGGERLRLARVERGSR